MAIKLSPEFGDELRAAGIDVNKGLGWNEDGELYNLNRYTSAEQSRIKQVADAHIPGKTRQSRARIIKVDILRRMTGADEFEKYKQVRALFPEWEREIFDQSSYVLKSDPLYSQLEAAAISVYGEARALQLLASSED